ncbi:hypothetical protein Y1Q_0023049 [Alligator mississippiensis]|uniref:Uncharacterized protein n=1 Tax=Alligator mississippiensis TaxID=8496 RepID=A0A151P0U9_ALLMI|nr:hypothetical protein Y1Q_0023049 [Alligator mississippiensis]
MEHVMDLEFRGQWASPTVCNWIERDEKNKLLVVEIPTGRERPSALRVPDCVIETKGLNLDLVTVIVVNPTLKDIVVHPGQKVALIKKAEVVSPEQEANPLPIDPSTFFGGNSPVPKSCKARLWDKLGAQACVFSLNDWDVGEAKGVKYHIRLSNPRPFRERSRHIPLAEMAEIRRHLQELMDHRIIIESKSPYASRIVIVWKKNGQLRMRIDYRTLNTWPIIDQYTVPQLQEALDCFS